MRAVTRTAPAKINLGLDITGTRADGYHLLETVFQAVSIADTVTVALTESPEITLTCDVPAVPCSPKNIAWKAAQRYREAAGLQSGVQIQILKRIPMEAGMGGGSTDGAAVLLALQELTGNALPQEKLLEIAVSLGADVPFFLYGGTAYGAGQGYRRRIHGTGIRGNRCPAKSETPTSAAAAKGVGSRRNCCGNCSALR